MAYPADLPPVYYTIQLNNSLGSGYEWWHNFYEYHKLAYDELEAFDYQAFKANGFEPIHLGECKC